MPPRRRAADRANPAELFAGDGEMARLMRAKDWSTTPLGPIERWPLSLRTTVRIMLSSRHPMFLWWGPELIQLYNDAYLPSFGKGKHPTALGQPGRACWPEIWPIIGPQIEQVMEHGKPTWNEDQLVPIFRNGQLEEVYWTYGYSPVFDDDGVIAGTLVVCTETTARVVNERVLRSSEERLATLFESAPAFVCTLRGPEHVFELVNPLYQRLVGAGRPLLGRSVKQALPEVVSQGFTDVLDSVYATGNAYVGRETAIRLDRHGDGRLEDAFLTFVYQPRRAAQGHIEGIDVFGFEVTEQVRALARAEQLAEQLRRSEAEFRALAETLQRRTASEQQLIGIVSHDLRTPLQTIKFAAALLGEREDLDGPAAQLVLRIRAASDRAARMVNDLLDFTQARLGGGIPIQPKPLELHRFTSQILEEVRASYPERELLVLAEGDDRGQWDPDRLAQVITNLLGNGLKYSPSGTPVSVRTLADGDCVLLQVHNWGPAIPQEAMSRLFQPMQRASSTPGAATRSVGLGLYIVTHIVEGHGGTVSVSSNDGEGTTFTVRLPRER